MKRLPLLLVFLPILLGCGGGTHHSGPRTADQIADWLEEAGECEGVELKLTRAVGRDPKYEDNRFDRASVSGLVSCGGVNGYVSYYRFPSAKVRASSTHGREGLLSNELFCFAGPELVVNGLLGYDQTAGFCKRLGFQIHRPTHELSARQNREHHLELRAQRLVAHITGTPTPNLSCEHLSGDLLKFECVEFISGKVVEVELVMRRNRYVIKGCARGEACALRTRRPTSHKGPRPTPPGSFSAS